MFAGMFKSLFEPFTGATAEQVQLSPAGIATSNLQQPLNYYYSTKRPNGVLVGRSENSNIDFTNNTATYVGNFSSRTQDLISQLSGAGISDISTGRYISTITNSRGESGYNRRTIGIENGLALPDTGAVSGNLIQTRNDACQGSGSEGGAFAHLSDLAANFNPSSKLRCGWIYNTNNPAQGIGLYGTIDGPVVDVPAGRSGSWKWDLNEAKELFHTSICNSAPTGNCLLIDNAAYKNKCGYCKTSNKLVPINGNSIAYPYSSNNGIKCLTASLVTNVSMCPRDPPPLSPAAAALVASSGSTRGTCSPLSTGALPRDCLIQTAAAAGCTDAGTLINALKTGSDTNYLDTLVQAQSYIKYQQDSTVSLNETALKTGKITVTDALSDFQDLYSAANSSTNIGLKESATDLCFTKGSFDSYDFCTELLPTSRPPFSLDCLQKAFKREGGQETGSLYPKPGNITRWNSYDNWSDVTNAINVLKTKVSSTDRAIQQRAIEEFQGIPLDDKAAPIFARNAINNVEIFWFTPDTNLKSSSTYNTTFLGRRIRSQIPSLDNTTGVPGAIGAIGSFVYFTNVFVAQALTVKIQVVGDSGFVFARNRGTTLNNIRTMPMVSDYSLGGYGTGLNRTNQELSDLTNIYGSPVQKITTNTWTFQPGVPNIITGYYIGNGKTYNVATKGATSIPDECECYGRRSADNAIRLYSESECDSLGGNFHGNGECTKKQGGSYSWDCRGLNTQNPCPNQWNLIPGSMLYLIQDPFAPMISFNLIQNYTNYNCDYPFMDKRLSSHKMKWAAQPSGGPTFKYPNRLTLEGTLETPEFPLGLSYLQFRQGSGMTSRFFLKVYSFTTLVYIVRFTKVPADGQQSLPFILWSTYPSIDWPTIFVVGKGNNTAKLQVGSGQNQTGTTATTNAYGCTSPPKSTDGPTIRAGETYIITMHANRSSPSDIYTLNSLSIGAGLLSELQIDNTKLTKSSPVVWPNRKSLDDPDSGASDYFLIGADANCQFDLFSIQMFDYELSGANLGKVAKGSWPVYAPNPTTPDDQNPYV